MVRAFHAVRGIPRVGVNKKLLSNALGALRIRS